MYIESIQEAWVQSLGWEDPMEKGAATHSTISVQRIPQTDEPGELSSPWGHKESDTTEQLTHFFYNPSNILIMALFKQTINLEKRENI